MLPGMIFNGRKRVAFTDALTGQQHSVLAGRLECTMQARLRSVPAPLLSALPWAGAAQRAPQPGSQGIASLSTQRLNVLRCAWLQNLVDQLGQTFQAALPPERLGDLNTFTVFNSRRKARLTTPICCHKAQLVPQISATYLLIHAHAAGILQACQPCGYGLSNPGSAPLGRRAG